MRVVALIPAYNEAGKVGLTVAALREAALADQIIVIDDKSTDSTAEEAAAAGADVIRLTKNVGKGGAVNRGLKAAGDYDVVLLIDADVTATATEAGKLLAPVQKGETDMAVAILSRREGTGGFGLALGLARRLIRRRGGLDVTAPLSGQRALTKTAVAAATPLATDYGLETAMTIDVLRAGLRVTEVPAAFTHSYTYRDMAGFRHRGRQFLDILKVMFRWPRGKNYAGQMIPTSVGVVFGGVAAVAGLLWLFTGALGQSPTGRFVTALFLLTISLCGLGWADDVYGGQQAKGFRGHLRELRRGRITTGLIKAGGAGVAAIIAVWYVTGEPLNLGTIVNGVIIALAVNAFNLLDLRPGRSLKWFMLVIIFLAALSTGAWVWQLPGVWLMLFTALVLFPFDLRGKLMLGDAGSNVLGGVVGLLAVICLTTGPKITVGIIFLLVNIVSERWSFSRIIAAVGPLRWLDDLGRPHAK